MRQTKWGEFKQCLYYRQSNTEESKEIVHIFSWCNEKCIMNCNLLYLDFGSHESCKTFGTCTTRLSLHIHTRLGRHKFDIKSIVDSTRYGAPHTCCSLNYFQVIIVATRTLIASYTYSVHTNWIKFIIIFHSNYSILWHRCDKRICNSW